MGDTNPIPREALLPLPEVVRLTNLCQAEIYARMKLGTFPLARQISVRKIAWMAGEVFDWFVIPDKGNPLILPTLLSEDEIVRAAKSHHATGVYFLIADERIVYIGKSHNVFSRVNDHRASKKFDAWHYVLCEPSKLTALEAAYIKKYQPPLNVVGILSDALRASYG